MQSDLNGLKEKIRTTSERLDFELRARGFDPAQIENLALPSKLASLYEERNSLIEQLSVLTESRKVIMSELDRIADQFRRSLEGEAWHGPSVLETIKGITAKDAAAHPIPSAHSIWELVLHITAWVKVCERRLRGDRAQLSDDENFPPVTDVSEAAWEKTRADLSSSHELLIEAIRNLDESRLDQPIIDDQSISYSTTYVTLQGGVQHSLYHAGQIAILKKTIQQS